MAIPLLAPTIARSRAAVVDRGTRVVLRLVPELRVEPGEQVAIGAFIKVLVAISMASLIALLFINTSLNQDAFVLSHLKHEMNIVNDQRDAILRQAAVKASPDTLSVAATKLGMVPNTIPTFITLNAPASNASTSSTPSANGPTKK